MTTKSLDVVAITETWLKAKETSTALADITPQGYSLIHKPRRGKQGGGVAIIMTNNKFDVTPTDSARNLGLEFDKDFNFKKHISKVCRSCYYHIRDLRRLRRCLTAEVTKTISTSLVSCKLDYCNSILYNKQGAECSELLGQGCDPFFTILQCYTFVKIPTLAPCSIQNKTQNMHPHI